MSKTGDNEHKDLIKHNKAERLKQLEGVIVEALHAYESDLSNASAKMKLSDAYRNLGFWQADEGHFREAIVSLTKAVEIDPDNIHTQTTLSAVYKDLGITQVREGGLHVIVSGPDSSAFYKALGVQLDNPKYVEEATASFTKALELDPGNKDAKKNLSAIYKALGVRKAHEEYFEEAIVRLTKAVEIDPSDVDAKMTLFIEH